MGDRKYLIAEEVAEQYRGAVSVATLRNRRAMRIGPAFVKMGKAILYPIDELNAWEKRTWCRVVHLDDRPLPCLTKRDDHDSSRVTLPTRRPHLDATLRRPASDQLDSWNRCSCTIIVFPLSTTPGHSAGTIPISVPKFA